MHTRFMLIAALAASAAAPLGAEPAKSPAQQSSQPGSRPAEVLLASADIGTPASPADSQTPQADIASPQADSQSPVPAKRPRAARVTTCRCAGQLPQQP